MKSFSWLKSWGRRTTGQACRPIRRATRLGVVALEDRTVPAQFLVTSGGDDGSAGTLRWAIGQANTATGADEIVFEHVGFIPVTGGELSISDDLTIIGPGANYLALNGVNVVNGGIVESRIFHIESGVTASISGLTIMKGFTREGNGGGILNEGILSVSNCVLAENRVFFGGGKGGGIYNVGVLTVLNTEFTGNRVIAGESSPSSGGAIYNAGTATVYGSTFSENFAHTNSSFYASAGGGIYNAGSLTVINSTLSNNFLRSFRYTFGGGICTGSA